MADNNAVIEQAPVTTAPVTTDNVQSQPAAPEVDLITKVTNFKPKASDNIKNAPEQPEFEKITDPVAREAAKQAVERIRRGMQSDYTKKVEEAQKLVEQSKNWTAERIQQELLTNPQFLQAAQQIIPSQNPPNSGLTNEEFSTLTDAEKAKLAQVDSLKEQVNQLTQSNQQARVISEITQRDAQLSTKYSDYNPVEINSAAQELGKMNLASVREYIYKATRHDDHVAAAYELGKQEALQLNKEKVSVIGLNGIDVNPNESPLPKNKGETDTAYFVRLAQSRLAQSRKK